MTGTWLVQAAEEGEQGLRVQDHEGLGPGCPREGAGLSLRVQVPDHSPRRITEAATGGIQRSNPTPSLHSWGN